MMRLAPSPFAVRSRYWRRFDAKTGVCGAFSTPAAVSTDTNPMSGGRIAASDEKIGETKQHRDALRVLRQAPVAHLGIAEVALHIQERVLHLRPNRRFALLSRFLGTRLVEPPAPARVMSEKTRLRRNACSRSLRR